MALSLKRESEILGLTSPVPAGWLRKAAAGCAWSKVYQMGISIFSPLVLAGAVYPIDGIKFSPIIQRGLAAPYFSSRTHFPTMKLFFRVPSKTLLHDWPVSLLSPIQKTSSPWTWMSRFRERFRFRHFKVYSILVEREWEDFFGGRANWRRGFVRGRWCWGSP
jgi:hypothetical protein